MYCRLSRLILGWVLFVRYVCRCFYLPRTHVVKPWYKEQGRGKEIRREVLAHLRTAVIVIQRAGDKVGHCCKFH